MMAMVPRRVTGSAFAATVYSIDPSPWPLAVPLMVSQGTSLSADHEHSRAVLIVICPVAPCAGALPSIGETVTPQRGRTAGAVAVDVEDPQPASERNAAREIARRAVARSGEEFDRRMFRWVPVVPLRADRAYQKGAEL